MTAPVQAQVQMVSQPQAKDTPLSQHLLDNLDGKEYLDYLEETELSSDLPQHSPLTSEPGLEACPARLCSRVLRYNRHIEDAAEKYQVDANLIRGVIAQESQGFPNAGSPKGARGLMQLMPATARTLGVRNRSDARQSVMGGTRYLSQLLRDYGGNVEKALWAYNAGPRNLAKGIKPAETRQYIPAVQEYARQFESLFKGDPT
ncbi:MAG: lytic transglycosylase domain-containing protein [Vulcanimicrobiota bacterium]